MNPIPLIKIVIADDHTIFRNGLKSMLYTTEPNLFSIVTEAANGQEVLEAVALHQPHVVLMDVQMPVMNGIEATAWIKEHHPQVHVIALSYGSDCEHVLAMAKVGADGYLLKNASLDEIAFAIRTVHQGYSYYTPATSSYLTAQLRGPKREAVEKPNLTRREAEILELICEGNSSKEIAATLFVSKRTVDSFRDKIIKKTGVKNTMQLLRYAIREKMVKA